MTSSRRRTLLALSALTALAAAAAGVRLLAGRRSRSRARLRVVPARAPAEAKVLKENEIDRRWHSQPRDVVDEASWQSFPASDPPAL